MKEANNALNKAIAKFGQKVQKHSFAMDRFLISFPYGLQTILVVWFKNDEEDENRNGEFYVYRGRGRFTYQINLSEISSNYRFQKRLTEQLDKQ